MQVVINKCFLLNPENKFGANLSCRFQEKRHRAEGWATSPSRVIVNFMLGFKL